MKRNTKIIIQLIFLIAASLFAAGCLEEPEKTSSIEDSCVVEVTALDQIDEALLEGPVFLKLGSERCGPCRAMKPVMAEMADKYEGNATVMFIDTDNSRHLASYFGVAGIPDSCVIAGIEDGKYLYMKQDGNVTTDRFRARILGLRDKEYFESLLEQALLREEGINE
ncbi:MAG: thioredoxin family protein [Methanosarcinaceae archaeon]|nr:thioredoxin family protein [Methanosarcinaceae archaeon]MDD4496761.1 thioredoxin family protein [Methanosarcinaceae archaeon]